MNQVMSFLPPVYRWDSLRLKYTDEFLTEGLKKKSITRIKVIFNAIHKFLLGVVFLFQPPY